MVSLVRDGAISPTELVQAHLRQIEARNPELNAFVNVFAESALEEARTSEAAIRRGEPLGLLHGVPVTVKDSFDIAEQPTLAGSRLRAGHRAAEDASAIARLRTEGAILLGRTNTPEMLANYETDNFITGRTNNPWNLARTPGGSSGGEAAAIAALCSPGGIASDGGGSIRVPAHFCGIAGLKPTTGRVPATGHFPALGNPAGLTSVIGPMARTAQDLRLLFSALASFDERDPFSVSAPLMRPMAEGARIGLWPQFYQTAVDSEIKDAVSKAAALLEDRRFRVEEFRPVSLERAPNTWAFLFSQWPQLAARRMYEGREMDVHWTLSEFWTDAVPTAEQALFQLASRDRMRAGLLRQMNGLAAILMPVCGIPAFEHRQRKWTIDDQSIGLFQATMPAVIANVLGLPAVTIPIALSSNGLPLGVQLMGHPYGDELLLDLAIHLEEARGPWTGPK
jgi:Asp-tRNA(Asn)/Glu-tRNA(Gln) amidotransferase A subunit family amidase